jgi:hypothetical protein
MEISPEPGPAGVDRSQWRAADQLGTQVVSHAHPTTRRETRSITVARYSQPFQVRIRVISPTPGEKACGSRQQAVPSRT